MVKGQHRDYGDGALYQRESDKRWVGSFRHNGERKYVYGDTRPEAKKKLEEAKRKAKQGVLVSSNRQKLTEYLDYWLDTIGKSVEASTLESYRDNLLRVRKPLGSIQLQKLTRHQIQQFVNVLELATSTIHQTVTTLDMALDAAVKWKYLEINPCKDVVLPKVEQEERTILTPAQVQHLLRFVHGQPLEPFIVLALGTGMRKGEICALRWADVDMERNTIRVDRKVYRLRHPDGKYRMTEGKPKSRSSIRTIPMASFVKETLVRHRKRQVEQRLQAMEWLEKDLIFCGNTGDFFSLSSLDWWFKKLLWAAGLPDIPIHALRHACNTLLRLMGVDPVTRQRILGHARPDITEDVYGHSYLEMQQDAMQKLDRLLSDDDQNFRVN